MDLGNLPQWFAFIIACAAFGVAYRNYKISDAKNRSDFTLKLLERWNGEDFIELRGSVGGWLQALDARLAREAIVAEVARWEAMAARELSPEERKRQESGLWDRIRAQGTELAVHQPGWRLDINRMYREADEADPRQKEGKEIARAIHIIARHLMDIHILYSADRIDRELVRLLLGPSVRYWDRTLRRLDIKDTQVRPALFSEPGYYNRWLFTLAARFMQDNRNCRLASRRWRRLLNRLLWHVGVRVVGIPTPGHRRPRNPLPLSVNRTLRRRGWELQWHPRPPRRLCRWLPPDRAAPAAR